MGETAESEESKRIKGRKNMSFFQQHRHLNPTTKIECKTQTHTHTDRCLLWEHSPNLAVPELTKDQVSGRVGCERELWDCNQLLLSWWPTVG